MEPLLIGFMSAQRKIDTYCESGSYNESLSSKEHEQTTKPKLEGYSLIFESFFISSEEKIRKSDELNANTDGVRENKELHLKSSRFPLNGFLKGVMLVGKRF